ncbi:MAG: phosphoribosylaminoimidazolesuccinocarboxamide synthase [Pyrinomonadaceae bacterium]
MKVAPTVSEAELPGLQLLYRGKVRDVYEVDANTILLVATDRISAFDCVLPTIIPDKGKVLTQLSSFWFEMLRDIVPSHLITTEIDAMPESIRHNEWFRGRSTLAHRTEVVPVECVVRGYLEGSGWKDYKAESSLCGHSLPPGLLQCDRLYDPMFTPSTKARAGHDENITGLEFSKIVGHDTAAFLKSTSLKLYKTAAEYALKKGIIIADTKFEFGVDKGGNIILIDEILTPDSSRFWDANLYEAGHAQLSFDKQYVREYLETLDWDKTPPAPTLPPEVIAATRSRYITAFQLLTGHELV